MNAEYTRDIRLLEAKADPSFPDVIAQGPEFCRGREDDRVSEHLAALGKMGPNDSRFGTGEVSDINRYIKLGPLGRTFAAAERHVLLIDEVDKADLEFPKGGKYPAKWADLGPRYNQ